MPRSHEWDFYCLPAQWISPRCVPMQATVRTTPAVMGSMAFSRMHSPSIGRFESTSPIQVNVPSHGSEVSERRFYLHGRRKWTGRLKLNVGEQSGSQRGQAADELRLRDRSTKLRHVVHYQSLTASEGQHVYD